MQITLSSHQSKILEFLSQQAGYNSLEDAIDVALVLLADQVQQGAEEAPEYLEWIEQTRLRLEEGAQASARGESFDASEVVASLRGRVAAAKATPT